MSGLLSVTTTLVTSSSRYVSGVVDGSIDIDRRSRTSDRHLPWDPDGAYGGICGSYFFSDIPRREHVPVVFVHGNTADATTWLPTMESFLGRGDTGEDVWAITFRRPSPSHEDMAAQLDSFVQQVRAHTGYDRVHVVSHSLGVTGVRYWLARYGRYDWVDSFVGMAGANHGSSRCERLANSQIPFGSTRANWFLNPANLEDPSHPLARLNETETPGDVDYYTLRATDDRFFADHPESPKLAGATDRLIDATHEGLVSDEAAVERTYDWLRSD